MKEITLAGIPINTCPFTVREIIKRLRKCENGTPGPDGIIYNHLKKVVSNGIVLTPLYNSCLKLKAFPEAWKRTTIICIFKKEISNIRETGGL